MISKKITASEAKADNTGNVIAAGKITGLYKSK